MTCPPGADQLPRDAARPIDWNGKAKTGTWPGTDQGVDPDHFTLRVQQRTTGITRVDRGIGLNQIQTLASNTQLGNIAAEVADDSHGHGVLEAIGIAHRNRPIAHPEPIRIPQRSGGPGALSVQAHNCQVREGVLAHHLAGHAPAIGELHLQLIGSLHHMGVGEQQTLGVKNHTAALAALHPGARFHRPWGPEKMTEQRIHEQPLRDPCHPWTLHRPSCLQGDHSWTAAFDGSRHEGLTRQRR